ncbi:MAG: hypothetical protein GY757_45825, partial [bacterium]|nr:hypothetical protein [bacterium]
MRILILLVTVFLTFANIQAIYANNEDELKFEDILKMDLEELLAVKIVSASLKKEHLTDAPSNVTIITAEMIENRGYRNLVEICEDLPGV